MNTRLAFIGVLALSLGLAGRSMAAVGSRPDRYQPLNPVLLQDQTKQLNEPRLAIKDLNTISARVHQVDVSEISPDMLPAGDRPRGSVQLDKVLIVDPSK